MVADCAQLGRVELSTVKVVAAQVDVVVLEMAFDVSSCGLHASQLRIVQAGVYGAYMNVQTTKVLRELFLSLGTYVLEVLTAEHDDSTLGDEQSKLVLLSI